MTAGLSAIRWGVLAATMALAACAPDVVERTDARGMGPLGKVDAPSSSAAVPGFGEVSVVCGLSRRELGKRIDTRPERGPAKWTLHDTAPGSTGARAFHVTGFDDGCARRITGALVMFGSVELYELVHYTGLSASGETGATDRAYEALRRSVCGTSRDRPCDEGPLKRLTRTTAFVTAFPRKGHPRHLELLMHGGALKATAVK